MKIRIISRHFSADKKLKAYIEKKAQKLTRYFDRITSLEVELDLTHNGQIKDKIVEIRAKVPGKQLVYRDVRKRFETAFDGALKGVKARLKRYKGVAQAH